MAENAEFAANAEKERGTAEGARDMESAERARQRAGEKTVGAGA